MMIFFEKFHQLVIHVFSFSAIISISVMKVKKIVLLTVFYFIFFTVIVQAQIGRYHFGMQSGFVYSNVVNTWKLPKSESKIASNWFLNYAYNLYVGYDFSQKISVAFEPGFIEKSGYDVSLTYLQMPLQAEFSLLSDIKLLVGPEINFLISNNDVKKYNSLDLATNIGLYFNGDSGYDFGVKFSRSLRKIWKNSQLITDEYGNVNVPANFRQYYFYIYTRYTF